MANGYCSISRCSGNEAERELLSRLRECGATVWLTADSGVRLKSVSDGRAGDGRTHWRAIYVGKKLVADLSDCAGIGGVTIAYRGDLRKGYTKGQHHTFHGGLRQAVKFLTEQF